jgi:hypothetical protein
MSLRTLRVVLSGSSIVFLGAVMTLLGCDEGSVANPSATSPAADGGTSVEDAASETGTAGLDTGGPLSSPFTCGVDIIQDEPRPGAPFLEQLRAQAGLDVLEERLARATPKDGDPQPLRAGTPCSGATDATTCQSAFTQLSSGGEALRPAFDEVDYMSAFIGQERQPPGYFLAHTKGDVVGKVSNATELRALFPTVDTPAKALLYANAAGYRVECHRATGWLREDADGWTLLTSRDHESRCSRTDVVLLVRRDGSTEERSKRENMDDRCT